MSWLIEIDDLRCFWFTWNYRKVQEKFRRGKAKDSHWTHQHAAKVISDDPEFFHIAEMSRWFLLPIRSPR